MLNDVRLRVFVRYPHCDCDRLRELLIFLFVRPFIKAKQCDTIMKLFSCVNTSNFQTLFLKLQKTVLYCTFLFKYARVCTESTVVPVSILRGPDEREPI